MYVYHGQRVNPVANQQLVNKEYPQQVWLTTILVSPLLYMLGYLLWHITDAVPPNLLQALFFLVMTILVGLGFSLPALAVCYLQFQFIVRVWGAGRRTQAVYALTAILALVTTFAVMFGKAIIDDWEMVGCYVAGIIIGTYRRKIRENPATQTLTKDGII